MRDLAYKTAIVGYGEASPRKVAGKTSLEFTAEAAVVAMRDAGVTPARIDGVFTGYTTVDPYPFYSAALCEFLGITPRVHAAIHTGGSVYGQMFGQAMTALATGRCNVALVAHGDNRASGLSRSDTIAKNAAGAGHPDYENPLGLTVPAAYALAAARHMHLYGTTHEQLASLAVIQREHALLNPNALMQKPLTLDAAMEARPIATPLRMFDCCLVSDFGGAFILTRAERAGDHPNRPVLIAGYGEFMSHEYITAMPEITVTGAVQSGAEAFAMAGMTASQMDFAQLYDCFTITPLLVLEDLGFCAKGEGGAFVADAANIGLGGRVPLNTYGGMLSASNGGICHFVEAVRQLRGEAGARQIADAQAGIVHAQGGVFATHASVVLARGH